MVSVLGLTGCSNTSKSLQANLKKENISNTNIIFVEKKIPVTIDNNYSDVYSQIRGGGALVGGLAGLMVGSLQSADIKRVKSICASCADFDFNEPIRTHLLETFNKIDWLRNKNFCIVDTYKKAKKELQKITPETIYIIIESYYMFSRKFYIFWGNCNLELYKYNENFNLNSKSNRKKNRIAKLIYDKKLQNKAVLQNYNSVFGINKNVQQWYGKLPQHIENFAKAFAQNYFDIFK